MKKLSIFLMLHCLGLAIVINTAYVHGLIDERPEPVQEWFKNLPNAKPTLTNLHFYFHDTVSGKNPSAIIVAQSNFTLTSPTSFGLIRMMDNPLTVGPEPDSKIIGQARRIYGSASFEEIDLLMTLNYVFTDGKFSGSTLSILRHNPVFHEYREMPIVGGSGVFRLAQGIATARTVWSNGTSQDAVVEYHVVVLHYLSSHC